MSTFVPDDNDRNPYLIDLRLAQEKVMDKICGNRNEHVPFCSNAPNSPSELWIRWKSNPIAMPAFDVWYDKSIGDAQFDEIYRTSGKIVEMGQLTHSNSTCNDTFKVVLSKW